jgi:DNA-binding winged helix-turn-helix (wHTH) protein/TolB-like protein
MSWRFNGFRFDPSDGSLTRPSSGESVTLRPQLGRLLEAFLGQPDTVLDRDRLCRAVWDESTVVDFESGLAALIRELRQAFERLGGSSEMVETVPRRGYRLRVESVERDVAEKTAPAPEPEPEPASERTLDPERLSNRALFLWPLIVAGLVLGLVVLWHWFERNSDTPPTALAANPTLAILPFDVIGPDELSPEASRRMQLLIADGLLAGLWQAELDELVLIGRAALRPYADRADQAAAVADDLGVDLLIEGSLVSGDGEHWQVDARLLSMPAGTVLWSARVEWDQATRPATSEPAGALVADLAEQWSAVRRGQVASPKLR